MYGACVLATGCMEVYLGVWLVLPQAALMCNLLLVHVWGVLDVWRCTCYGVGTCAFCLCVKAIVSGWPR